MFCDLCFAWQDANAHTQRERSVMAIRLGIDLFALTHDVFDALSESDRCADSNRLCMHATAAETTTVKNVLLLIGAVCSL